MMILLRFPILSSLRCEGDLLLRDLLLDLVCVSLMDLLLMLLLLLRRLIVELGWLLMVLEKVYLVFVQILVSFLRFFIALWMIT
jgi:hypothetical protein